MPPPPNATLPPPTLALPPRSSLRQAASRRDFHFTTQLALPRQTITSFLDESGRNYKWSTPIGSLAHPLGSLNVSDPQAGTPTSALWIQDELSPSLLLCDPTPTEASFYRTEANEAFVWLSASSAFFDPLRTFLFGQPLPPPPGTDLPSEPHLTTPPSTPLPPPPGTDLPSEPHLTTPPSTLNRVQTSPMAPSCFLPGTYLAKGTRLRTRLAPPPPKAPSRLPAWHLPRQGPRVLYRNAAFRPVTALPLLPRDPPAV
jgi:hypothetical protein